MTQNIDLRERFKGQYDFGTPFEPNNEPEENTQELEELESLEQQNDNLLLILEN